MNLQNKLDELYLKPEWVYRMFKEIIKYIEGNTKPVFNKELLREYVNDSGCLTRLSYKIGTTPRTMYDLLSGKRKYPYPTTIKKLSDYFGVENKVWECRK